MDTICIPFEWILGLCQSTAEKENECEEEEQQRQEPSNSPRNRQSKDEVEVLYSPDKPEMEIIFFPGLLDLQCGERLTKTWVTAHDEDKIWPREWLSKVFPKARILFVSRSCAIEDKLARNMTKITNKLEEHRKKAPSTAEAQAILDKLIEEVLDEDQLNELKRDPSRLAFIKRAVYGSRARLLAFIGEALVYKIVRQPLDIGQGRPVFLVGHSLGGIVIKHFIQSCKILQEQSKKVGKFLENLRGVFYYATPHDDCSGVKHFADRNGMSELKNIEIDNYWISEDYKKIITKEESRILRDDKKIVISKEKSRILRTYAVLEGEAPKGYRARVVDESSARSDVDDFYIHTSANHLTLCRATDEKDPVVIGKLAQFIVDGEKEGEREIFKATVVPLASKEPRKLNATTSVKELNESVWEFCPQCKPEMEIIFFHGLQQGDYHNAVWRTWQAKNNSNNIWPKESLKNNTDVIWPKEWLSQVFPKARILSISYNSSATNAKGQIDMYNLGRSLVSNIIDDVNHKIGQNCPVFLVGHSLGGIVIKQFILTAIAKKNSLHKVTYKTEIQKIEKFLKNLRGVFYYATPHGGSPLADVVTRIPIVRLTTTPTVRLLTTLFANRGRINEEFRQQRANLKVRSFAMAEGRRTRVLKYLPCMKFFIVSEGSARHDVDDFYTHTGANHYTVCQAQDKNDPLVIGKLTQFITSAMPKPIQKGLIVEGPDEQERLAFGRYHKVSSWPEPRSWFNEKKSVRQLNDSVWEVYAPEKPEVDVIFFHGFQPDDFRNAFWKTWVARDTVKNENDKNWPSLEWVNAFWKSWVAGTRGENDSALVWPKEWLPRWLPKARILLVSYNSNAKVVASQNDMYALGENLVGNIVLDTDCNAGQKCPVFLVGHSVGGIVIKQFILSAIGKRNLLDSARYKRERVRIDTFLQNFKGVSYYATPHGGSDIAKYASRSRYASPVLGLLDRLDIERQRINEEFRQHRRILETRALAQAETDQFTYGRWTGIVVDEKSARQDFDEYDKIAAHHFNICKAPQMNDYEVIGRLTQFITNAMPKDKPITVIRSPREGFSRYDAISDRADAGEDYDGVNDRVWEIYSPMDKNLVEMDIIFFSPDESGDTFWKTWLAMGSEELVWPKEWLPKWFPQARILFVIPGKDLEILIDNIILHPGNCEAGQKCPVFLVGNSVGGTVLANFLLYADSKKNSLRRPRSRPWLDNSTGKKIEANDTRLDQADQTKSLLHPECNEYYTIENFLKNVKGVHSYYATPQALDEDVRANVSRLEKKLNPSERRLEHGLKVPDLVIAPVEGPRQQPLLHYKKLYPSFHQTPHPVIKADRIATDRHDLAGDLAWLGVETAVKRFQPDHHDKSAAVEVTQSKPEFTHNLKHCRAKSIDDEDVIGKLAKSIVNVMPTITCTPPAGYVLEGQDGAMVLHKSASSNLSDV